MNLSQMLQQSGVIESMARELKIDEQTARKGASALMPALVAGMGRHTTSAPGASGLGGLADVLGGALGGGSSGGLGGGLGGVLLDSVLHKDETPTKPGNDILGEIFGSKDVSRGVAEEAAGSTGIDPSILKRMLPILAMAVMGMMMKNGGGAGGGIGGALGGGLGGGLGDLLGKVVGGMGRR